MRKIIFVLPAAALLTACETPEQRMVTGAATGAAIGAAIDDDNRAKGAALGGAAGLAAAALIGPASNPGKCRYRDQYGQEYVADC